MNELTKLVGYQYYVNHNNVRFGNTRVSLQLLYTSDYIIAWAYFNS